MIWDKNTVRLLRKNLGLTQSEFARTLGCRQQTVSEWELGVYAPANAYGQLLNGLSSQMQMSKPMVHVPNTVERRIKEHAQGARQSAALFQSENPLSLSSDEVPTPLGFDPAID